MGGLVVRKRRRRGEMRWFCGGVGCCEGEEEEG